MFDLPEGILENITTYLNLIDLKSLSQTCHDMFDLSWKQLGNISKINLRNILNHSEMKTFLNSRRKYQNVQLSTDTEILEITLKQVEQIPSIVLKNLIIDIDYIYYEDTKVDNYAQVLIEIMSKILQRYEQEIENVCIRFDVQNQCEQRIRHCFLKLTSSKSQCQQTAHSIRSFFPKSNVIFEPAMELSSSVHFNDINKTFGYPKRIKIIKHLEKVKFDLDIKTVQHVTLKIDRRCDLRCFKNLESLRIETSMNPRKNRSINTLIESNKQTLTNLELYLHKSFSTPWNFDIPCQLKRFVLCMRQKSSMCKHIRSGTSWHFDLPFQFKSDMSTKMLRDQRNLRHMCLYSSKLTSNLLETLTNNRFLSSVDLRYCCTENTINKLKFRFFKNISKIRLVENFLTDFTLVNAILTNADKVDWLQLEVVFIHEELDIEEMPRKFFGNLRTLKLSGYEISDYVSKRINAPNLESCEIDWFPTFLFGHRCLRTLNIGAELDYDGLVGILENIRCLKQFHFKLTIEYYEKSLKYILENMIDVEHFRLDLVSQETVDHSEWLVRSRHVEQNTQSILQSLGIDWKRWGIFYKAEEFSFEINYF